MRKQGTEKINQISSLTALPSQHRWHLFVACDLAFHLVASKTLNYKEGTTDILHSGLKVHKTAGTKMMEGSKIRKHTWYLGNHRVKEVRENCGQASMHTGAAQNNPNSY